MYMKDKIKRLNVRLSEEQYDFLNEQAKKIDVSPSEFIRLVIANVYSEHSDEETRNENS